MDISRVLSLVSIAVALIAGAIGAVLARRQVVVAKSQAMMNFLNILAEVNSDAFRENIGLIWRIFSDESRPGGPVSELPADVRNRVDAVVNYFDQIGLLVAFGALDKSIIIGYLGNWLDQVWETLQSHIMSERTKRAIMKRRHETISGGYLVYYEHLVQLAREKPPQRIQSRQKLRRVET